MQGWPYFFRRFQRWQECFSFYSFYAGEFIVFTCSAYNKYHRQAVRTKIKTINSVFFSVRAPLPPCAKKNRTECAELTEINTNKIMLFSLRAPLSPCEKKFLLNFPGIQTGL